MTEYGGGGEEREEEWYGLSKYKSWLNVTMCSQWLEPVNRKTSQAVRLPTSCEQLPPLSSEAVIPPYNELSSEHWHFLFHLLLKINTKFMYI